MRTSDIARPITAKSLNENLFKQFNVKINFDKYTREQLEDARNKYRSKLFAQEAQANFNDLLNNESYQRDKYVLDVLNTRIKEMLGENIARLERQIGEAKLPMKTVKGKKVKEGAKADKNADKEKDRVEVGEDMEPEDLGTVAEINRLIAKGMHETDAIHAVAKKYGDDPSELASFYYQHNMHEGKHAKDCDCKECTGMYEADMGKHNNKTTGFKALAKKTGGGEKGAKIAGAQFQKMKKAGQLEETNARFKHNVRFVNESLQFLLNEDEEGKAKAITAASDIVNDFTSWMQRVGQYQTKSMIELADSIKANFGAAEAEQFKQAVAASLSQTLEVLTSQREAISGAVAVLAGEATPEAPMGQEPDMGMDSEMPPEDGMDTVEPDDMNPEPAGDEFAGAEGPSSNREVRESREARFARRLAEEHSIMSKLAR